MKLTINELNTSNYTLIEKLEHKELIPFVKKYLNRWSRTALFYYGMNIVLILSISSLFFYDFLFSASATNDWVFHFCLGFLFAFLLTPLHEYIHILAYKYLGATKTSFESNFKKFYFIALADQFIVDRKEFRIIALAPFVIISVLLVLLWFLVGHLWGVTISTMLLSHTAMCSGDFGLLGYFEFHQDKKVFTYDDADQQASYFYYKL